MAQQYQMTVRDIFRFRDGRAVLAGLVDGHDGYIPRGRFEVWLGDDLLGLLDVEGEMLACQTGDGSRERLRSVSNTTAFSLNREFVETGPLILKSVVAPSGRESQMHRHLLGIDSPPPDYVADPMTQGPVLPEGWDGDAWAKPGGRGCFLRAWDKASQRVAYGRGLTYEDARRELLEDVASGTRLVVISTRETGPDRSEAGISPGVKTHP